MASPSWPDGLPRGRGSWRWAAERLRPGGACGRWRRRCAVRRERCLDFFWVATKTAVGEIFGGEGVGGAPGACSLGGEPKMGEEGRLASCSTLCGLGLGAGLEVRSTGEGGGFSGTRWACFRRSTSAQHQGHNANDGRRTLEEVIVIFVWFFGRGDLGDSQGRRSGGWWFQGGIGMGEVSTSTAGGGTWLGNESSQLQESSCRGGTEQSAWLERAGSGGVVGSRRRRLTRTD
ncbi:hypothetical protein QBC39DRAFT_136467 [Podospora conica]|nr:hypothetical protein QBC39DRAFT_136467 [Schizothecium conicum]